MIQLVPPENFSSWNSISSHLHWLVTLRCSLTMLFWVGRNSVWVTLNGAFCREISSSVCLYLGDSESWSNMTIYHNCVKMSPGKSTDNLFGLHYDLQWIHFAVSREWQVALVPDHARYLRWGGQRWQLTMTESFDLFVHLSFRNDQFRNVCVHCWHCWFA